MTVMPMIRRLGPSAVPGILPLRSDIAIDPAMTETQVEILKSENISLSVIKDLRLIEDPEFVEEARQHLAPLLAAGVDQIVLGCTHYAFLCPTLDPIVAQRASLVDVADAVARQCVRLAGASARGRGQLSLLATAQPERLDAALPALGLTWLRNRLSDPTRLVFA